MKRISKVLVFLLMTVTFSLLCMPAEVNSTPLVRQYDILSNKWGVLLCQKGCIFSEPAKLLNFLTTDGSKDTGF